LNGDFGRVAVLNAKASILAYNHKDWQKAKESLRHDAVYDEKATHRRIEGRDDIITAWQGWAKAFPDPRRRLCASTAPTTFRS
jgi:hypothetical protein